MGYYTDYMLEIINDANHELVKDEPTPISAVIDWMKKAGEKGDIDDYGAQYDLMDGDCMNAKWYDHDQDMRKVSLAFPHLLLRLEGRGEDSEDLWHSYYHMGKCHECPATTTIIYPEFDPSQLK